MLADQYFELEFGNTQRGHRIENFIKIQINLQIKIYKISEIC